MAKDTYRDVNKENYLKALFLDVQKQAKMIDYDRHAKVISSFVMGNPTNGNSINGVRRRNGCIVISRSSLR